MTMNKNKFSMKSDMTRKVTITISRKQLWYNFMESWTDMAWDDYHGVDSLTEVAKVLLNGEILTMSGMNLKKLFRDGYTCLLMGDAMKEIDVNDILREIIVQDINDFTGKLDDSVVIHHNDIVF